MKPSARHIKTSKTTSDDPLTPAAVCLVQTGVWGAAGVGDRCKIPVWTTPACRPAGRPPSQFLHPFSSAAGRVKRTCAFAAGGRFRLARAGGPFPRCACLPSAPSLLINMYFIGTSAGPHAAAGPGRATPHPRLDEMIVISPNKQGKKSTAPPSPGPPHQTAGQMTWPSAARKAPGIRRTAGRGRVALAPRQIALRLDAALTPPPPANCRQPRRRQTPYYPRAHTHLRGCSRRCPSGTHLHAAAR